MKVPHKVLLAEDDGDLREDLKEWFADVFPGTELITAVDGEEGLELYRKHADFDHVVTDNDMPRMNGIDFTRAVHEINPTQKIIMISGGEKSDEIRALHITFISKLDPGSITHLLEAYLKHDL